MKRIIFVLVLGLLALGGCDATQQMDDLALETSLGVVNEAMAEGKIVSCFAGIDEDMEAVRTLGLVEDGCSSFETEEELLGFVVAGVVEAARCGDLVRVTSRADDDEDGEVRFYDMEGEVAEDVREAECSVVVTQEGEVDVAGVESDTNDTNGHTNNTNDVDDKGDEDEVDSEVNSVNNGINNDEDGE